MSRNERLKNKLDFISIFLFSSTLSVLGILFFAIEKPTISEVEGRSLCPMPNFNIDSVFTGVYMDSINQHFADNFPFRDFFVSTAFQLKNARGFKSEVTFYAGEIDVDAGLDIDTTMSIEDSLALAAQQDSLLMHNEGNVADVGKLSRGLLIYNGMAIQIFGGGRNSAKYAAKHINEALPKLPANTKVYVAITPTQGEFYLPSGYDKTHNSERKNIDTIYAYLDSSITTIDITKELHKHKDEYIFFNTDHHWTGKGAYYAYRAFCEKVGFIPLELSDMESKTIPNFLGSLYRASRDKRLKDNIDSVTYFKIPIAYQAYTLSGAGYGYKRKTSLYVENVKGGNAYSVFMGGDVPALCIESEAKTGRVGLILKNSFGNAFSPYLVPHYDRLFVIDYRYFKGNLADFIKKNGVTDFIIFHYSFSANTYAHIDMMKRLIHTQPSDIKPIIPEPVLSAAPKTGDSTQTAIISAETNTATQNN